MNKNLEKFDIMTGQSCGESYELPLSVSGEKQKYCVLGLAVLATALSVGMGPGMIIPTSGHSRIQHKLVV